MMSKRSTSSRLRVRRSTECGLVAAVIVGLAAPPAHATIGTSATSINNFFRVKREKVTPEKAGAARAEAQVKANAVKKTGDPMGAGVVLDEGASIWGDPVLYLDAADVYLDAAAEQSDTGLVDAAEERARISRDILFFSLDSAADKDFRLVEMSEIPNLINRADELLERCSSTRKEIESASAEPDEEEEEEDEPRKKPKKEKILFATGVASAAVGGGLLLMGGVGLVLGAVRQNQAEDAFVYGDAYDAVEAQGRNANLIAGLGLGIGGALAVTGVTLILLSKRKPKKGKKKKKKGGDGEDDAAPEDDNIVRVAPMFGTGRGGFAVSGRF